MTHFWHYCWPYSRATKAGLASLQWRASRSEQGYLCGFARQWAESVLEQQSQTQTQKQHSFHQTQGGTLPELSASAEWLWPWAKGLLHSRAESAESPKVGKWLKNCNDENSDSPQPEFQAHWIFSLGPEQSFRFREKLGSQEVIVCEYFPSAKSCLGYFVSIHSFLTPSKQW